MSISNVRNQLRYIWIAGIAALLLMPAAGLAQSATCEESLTARIRCLEDTEEIRTLLLNYGRHLDSRDLDAYSQLFAQEGEWVGGFGSAKSPAGIKAFMEENLGTGPNRGGTYHILSNFIIELDGDRATAWSRWAFITPGPENSVRVAQGGRYEDILVRQDGVWKFQRREAFLDIPATLPGPN